MVQVYKGLKSGVTDVAVKVLTYTEELEMQQFWVEINLLKSLSFHNNIVQFYGCVIDAANPMLVRLCKPLINLLQQHANFDRKFDSQGRQFGSSCAISYIYVANFCVFQ